MLTRRSTPRYGFWPAPGGTYESPLIDVDTDELETWDVTLDLRSPGGRATFEDELVVFEALGFRDIPGLVGPGLADRAMASKAFWEPNRRRQSRRARRPPVRQRTRRRRHGQAGARGADPRCAEPTVARVRHASADPRRAGPPVARLDGVRTASGVLRKPKGSRPNIATQPPLVGAAEGVDEGGANEKLLASALVAVALIVGSAGSAAAVGEVPTSTCFKIHQAAIRAALAADSPGADMLQEVLDMLDCAGVL